MRRGLLAALLALGACTTATAQSDCAPRDTAVEYLSEQWGEAIVGAGLESPTSILEVWVAEETGTWTIVRTTPDGMSCIVASGTDWRKGAPGPKGVEG